MKNMGEHASVRAIVFIAFLCPRKAAKDRISTLHTGGVAGSIPAAPTIFSMTWKRWCWFPWKTMSEGFLGTHLAL